MRAQAQPGRLAQRTTVVVRPLANPLPLGFLALAGGTLLVSGLQLEWLAAAESRQVALMLLAFVFPLQLVTSIFGFLARDVAAGTGMGVLAGTWASIALVMLDADQAGKTSDALGLLLLLCAAAMLVPAAAAATSKLVPAAVLTGAALRFLVTGLYQLTASTAWEDVAGIVGLALCALAVYAAAALALEDARDETVLPVGRHGPGAEALREGEPGVREQL